MKYAQAMADRMPTTMTLPDEFLALFDWMETNSFFMRSAAYPAICSVCLARRISCNRVR